MEPILQTKLFVPKNRTDLVVRPRLLARLNDGLNGKLVLVSSPAGYGKTTLAAGWISQPAFRTERSICWYAIDEEDNDPHQFFMYLASAVGDLPGAGGALMRMMQGNQTVSAKTWMKTFLQDVTSVTSPFVMILDDYHSFDSSELDDAVALLIEHMPPLMTLVLLSRRDPGFPVSRLRARGELLELRAEDLRFTDEEAIEFISNTMKLSLQPQQISALKNRTEGWIAGLKMAALSIQNRSGEDIDHFVTHFTGTHRFIMDYLSDEVLNQVSPSEQTFLLRTSVLSKFCAELCDAVLPEAMQGQAQAILMKLESSNSFVVPLDDERRWFRYHHLFADLLGQKLTLEERVKARKAASQWCAEHNNISDAIEYALAAEAWDQAIPLLIKHGLSFVFQGKLTTLRHWFDSLPRERLLSESRMCLDYAWALVNQGQLQAVEPYLLAAEEASGCAPETRTVSALIRANIARIWEDIPVMRREAELALSLTAQENAIARCTAFLQLGAAEMLSNAGDKQNALQDLQQAMQLAEQSHNMNSLLLSSGYMGLLHLQFSNVNAAKGIMLNTQQLAMHAGLEQSPLLTYVYLVEAHLAYLDGKMDEAMAALEKAETYGRDAGEISSLYRSSFLRGILAAVRGNTAGVKQALAVMRENAQALKNPQVHEMIGFAENMLVQEELPEEMLETLRMCAAGAALPAGDTVNRSGLADRVLVDPLSERELEILRLIAAGLKNKEIAEQMFISLNTVLFHTKNIYQKLGVNKRTQALLKAQELNLLE